MLAKWIRLGIGSGRVTTTYPVHGTEVIHSHEHWHVLPKPIRMPSPQEAERLIALCPTNAIQFTQDDETSQLFVDLCACIGCGRCIEATEARVFEWHPSLDFAGKARESLVVSISER